MILSSLLLSPAADVYANESHKGRGGWTWYTGSAGWMYQFIIGSLLGVELQKDKLNSNHVFHLDGHRFLYHTSMEDQLIISQYSSIMSTKDQIWNDKMNLLEM